MQFLPSPALVATLALAALFATSSVASAHVDTNPTRVRPGSTSAVTFTIGHGCVGSPTTRLVLRVPAGVAFIKAGAMPKGWAVAVPTSTATASTAKASPTKPLTTKPLTRKPLTITAAPAPLGTTITLRGPGLDPKRHHAFVLTLRFPTTTGTVLIPTIQGCMTGTQDWISASADADYPAPRVMVRV